MHKIKLLGLLSVFGITFLLTGCEKQASPEKLPRLVVFISVDQWRGDLPIKFAPYYHKGLKRFVTRGVWFQNATHDHSNTATGPGHLTLLSGRFPGSMGILSNNFYDAQLKRSIYSVEDDNAKIIGNNKHGESYHYVLGTSLGDWLKAAYPKAKVFSVSGKDRAAIFMAGAHPDGVYWYDWNDPNFVTSSYYRNDYPQYIKDFNQVNYPAAYLHRKWEKSQPDSFYQKLARQDDYFYERDISRRTSDRCEDPKLHHPVFPHYISAGDSGLTKTYYQQFGFMPFLDEVTLRLASTIAENEKLGQDDIPDLLLVSLSAHDVILHCTGPESQEEAELEMTLDRYLQYFMDQLEQKVPRKNILYVLVSDHGGMTMPEYLQAEGIPARRGGQQAKAFRDSLEAALFNRFGANSSKPGKSAANMFYSFGKTTIYVNQSYLTTHNLSSDSLNEFIQAEAKKQAWVARVYSRKQLINYAQLDSLGRLVAHSWNAERGPDWVIVPVKYDYLTSLPKGTGHGYPYYYDRHVPWIIMGDEFKPRTINTRVATVDIAPTLAAILKIKVPDNLDGHSVLNLFQN